MNDPDPIHPDLKATLRRLRLGRLLDVLPQRLALARQQKAPHQDFLLLLLSDEVNRRDAAATMLRGQRAHLDPEMQIQNWDATAKVTYDHALLNELVSLRFLEKHAHVAIVGPVGVGKTFLAHALGHLACAQAYSVHATRTDQMLKNLRHARLTNSHEAEIQKILAYDLLILDDFGMDAMSVDESRDIYEVMTDRHRRASILITSNRGPDEWLGTFAEPVRGQAAIDRFTGNSYDLVVEGETYRPREKPSRDGKDKARQRAKG